MTQWLSVIEWFNDENDGGSITIERKIFGPFQSLEDSQKFGEAYLRTEQTSEQLDCGVQWTTSELIPPT